MFTCHFLPPPLCFFFQLTNACAPLRRLFRDMGRILTCQHARLSGPLPAVPSVPPTREAAIPFPWPQYLALFSHRSRQRLSWERPGPAVIHALELIAILYTWRHDNTTVASPPNRDVGSFSCVPNSCMDFLPRLIFLARCATESLDGVLMWDSPFGSL